MQPNNDQEIQSRQALSAAMAEIHRRGWCDGTGGNFSCVLQRQPLQLLMAPSGVPKGGVRPEQLVVVDDQARICEGTGKASAETLLHLAIVEATGAGAVLHTHSQAGTLLSHRIGRNQPAELLLEDLEMLKGLEGITTHATAVALPVLPNDQDLARLSGAAKGLLSSAPHGLLVAGHGLYAWGADLSIAVRHLEILEFLLEQRWRQLLLEPEGLRPQVVEGVSHVLLDIEGTTCPISFVADVLFPYAAAQMDGFLAREGTQTDIQKLIGEVDLHWQHDAQAAEQGLLWNQGTGVAAYLRWLIKQDRKLTPLKELQGRIWEQGYRCGDLRGPLFADVPAALKRWHAQGLQLAVYSSGSVQAQQLLYANSDAGDLTGVFSNWFDTRSGSKQDASSYVSIAQAMGSAPAKVLFISDAVSELRAAASAGMQVLFSSRPGNPQSHGEGFETIKGFSSLQISP